MFVVDRQCTVNYILDMKHSEIEDNFTVESVLRDKHALEYLAFLSLHAESEPSDCSFGDAVYLDLQRKGDQIFDYFFKLVIKKYTLVSNSVNSIPLAYSSRVLEVLNETGSIDGATKLVKNYSPDAKQLSMFKECFLDRAFVFDVMLVEDWWLKLPLNGKDSQ